MMKNLLYAIKQYKKKNHRINYEFIQPTLYGVTLKAQEDSEKDKKSKKA